MYDPNSVTNHYGAYRGPLGEPLHRAYDGRLLNNGIPTGLSVDVGGRVIRTPYQPPPSPLNPAQQGGFAPAGTLPVEAPAQMRGPSWVAAPIYLWMALLALCTGLFVSRSVFLGWEGFGLHPMFGVAAAFAVVGLYRYGMTWFPTALGISLVSAGLWAMPLWAWRHEGPLRDLPTQPDVAAAFLEGFFPRFGRAMLVGPDLVVIAGVVAVVTLHFWYWRHRRAVVAEQGWLFNRGWVRAGRTLATLAAAACVLGLLLQYVVH